MLDQLSSILPCLAKVDLNLLKASRASLINIEDLNVNILLTFDWGDDLRLPGTKEPEVSDGHSVDDCKLINKDQISPTLFLRVPSSGNSNSEAEIQIQNRILPFNTGLYFDFTNDTYFGQDWWESCPIYQDVIPKVRFVPFLGPNHTFPSLESSDREFTIEITSNKLSIYREHGSVDISVNLEPVASTQINRYKFNFNSRKWSLRYLPSIEITKLSANGVDFIVQYQEKIFSTLWWLVHHHETRGDEGYLILNKE